MSTTRITQKISDIVARQFPEHIQTDYTRFIEFVEAYYRFMEQDGGAQEVIQNARSYSDVDATTSAFMDYLLNQYAPNVPRSSLINKPHLIKQIRAFYDAKGSEASFKMLFRMLFDADVFIDFPFENVLRASNGEWLQRASVRVETITGSTGDLKNRFLTVTKGIRTYQTPINSAIRLSSSITELYLDPVYLAPYEIGDVVTVSNANGVMFTGRISPTTVTAEVLYGGLNFKVGQIFNVSYGAGLNTLVKVLRVGSSGEILELKILNYGYGFTEDFTTNLDPHLPVNSSYGAYIDKLTGFEEYISLYSYDPLDPNRYFFSDYVEDSPIIYAADLIDVVDDSYTIPVGSEAGLQSEELASIRFHLGALGRYPGTYISNKGFLSEEQIRLENNKQYKAFTYQTNTDVDISAFLDIVKKLVHPAGNDIYNNRIITTTLPINPNLDLVSNISAAGYIIDSVDVSDSISLTIV